MNSALFDVMQLSLITGLLALNVLVPLASVWAVISVIRKLRRIEESDD